MNQITIDACPSTRNKTVVYFAILFTDCACAIKKDQSKEMSRPGMNSSHESVSNEAYPYSLASTNSDVLRLGFCTLIFTPLFLRRDPSLRTFPIEQGIRRRSRHLVHVTLIRYLLFFEVTEKGVFVEPGLSSFTFLPGECVGCWLGFISPHSEPQAHFLIRQFIYQIHFGFPSLQHLKSFSQ